MPKCIVVGEGCNLLSESGQVAAKERCEFIGDRHAVSVSHRRYRTQLTSPSYVSAAKWLYLSIRRFQRDKRRMERAVREFGFETSLMHSPIPGTEGTEEFLLHARH